MGTHAFPHLVHMLLVESDLRTREGLVGLRMERVTDVLILLLLEKMNYPFSKK